MSNTMDKKITNNIEDYIIEKDKCDQTFTTDLKEIKGHIYSYYSKEFHIEHIRRFNFSAYHVFASINRFLDSIKDLENSQKTGKSCAEKFLNEQDFRLACRDVCINIAVYLEKVKALCEFYFYMDRNKTRYGDKWIEILEDFERIEKGELIENFRKSANHIYKLKTYEFIRQIRNDEIHNESIIELKNYYMNMEDKPGRVESEYIVSEESLYDIITSIISPLKNLAKNLNKMIIQITPREVCDYISENRDTIKDIITPEERLEVNKEVENQYKKLLEKLI